ncbi:MAG: hypothetical protein ACPGJS_21195, partial [Flammeovirgaceae bacterium]
MELFQFMCRAFGEILEREFEKRLVIHFIGFIQIGVGFILMPILETNLRTTMLIAGSVPDPVAFFASRPAFMTLLILMLLVLLLFVRRMVRG